MDSRLAMTWRVVRTTAKGFSDDELMTRAAALAFYSALSFAPLLVLLLWIVASLRPEWQAQLVDSLNGLVGPRASEAVKSTVTAERYQPLVPWKPVTESLTCTGFVRSSFTVTVFAALRLPAASQQ